MEYITRRHESCPNCESKNLSGLTGFEMKNLVLCKNCELIFDQRIPSDNELIEHYSTYSYSRRKPCPEATIQSFERLLDKFEAWRLTGNILDVGCGQGDFLLAARNRGWKVYGTEYSPAAVELCRVENLHVSQGELSESAFRDQAFDIVTSFEVFEHISNGAHEIKNMRKKLRDGGLIYLTTPNFNSVHRFLERHEFQAICYPEHITFYTPKSILNLATSSSLKVIKLSTTGLEPWRLKHALMQLKTKNESSDISRSGSKQTSDELRVQITNSRKLQFLKSIVNSVLDGIGIGDTLKVWMVRS